MWWAEVETLADRLAADPLLEAGLSPQVEIEAGATIDETRGPVTIGAGTRVCAGAIIRGPAVIGRNCLIGNQAMIRGPVLRADGVRSGFASELKQVLVGEGVMIGPLCFVSDSKLDAGAYLGALVRTSNDRLDHAEIMVRQGNRDVPTGLHKLGCWIGEGTALGIQVIILPGRVVSPHSLFEPRITISRNFPPGRYRAAQAVEPVVS
jgi:bifunctional UDP-N-acetylglucosamine pyrophosphorylase/glucosamine-1-phosphate N-acetyltransferase